MSLSVRVSAFFLTALAVVLLGFSATLFTLAWIELHHQAEERRRGALETLVASAEVEPGGVEWEGKERVVSVANGEGFLCWVVQDERGQVIDHSPGLADNDPLRYASGSAVRAEGNWEAEWGGERWDLLRQTVHANGSVGDNPDLYPALVLTVAMPQSPLRSALQRLALVLAGVSLVCWLMAFVGGRYLCRRALRPLGAMADAARVIHASDVHQRLPTPRSADELEALGDAFNGLLDRLHEAHERQRRFTGDASHQLRTPLTALLGQVEVCLRHPRLAEEYQRVLKQVHAQGLHLHQLVEMLLYLARTDAEAHPTDLVLIDLTTWLPAYLAGWATHPRAPDLQLKPPLPSLPPVRVQPPLFSQILDNLLENACKYSDAGTPVELAVGSIASQVVVTVTDSGWGIAPEDLPHVFAPFYRSGQARRTGQPGIGLGLAVALRIATLFGGQMRAESKIGAGSRFELILPAERWS
jgi:signal transduction histidine kinase